MFTTTLLASFLVVGMPHILPCPAEHRVYADGEMPVKRKRKGRTHPKSDTDGSNPSAMSIRNEEAVWDSSMAERRRRECPVPKPGGLIGEILGFAGREKSVKNNQKLDGAAVKVEGDTRDRIS